MSERVTGSALLDAIAIAAAPALVISIACAAPLTRLSHRAAGR